jgi:hypothetical protein
MSVGISRTTDLSSKILRCLGTSKALGISIALRNQSDEAIVSASIDPMDYICAESFRRDYLAVNLLRKADFLDLGIDREKVALDSFFSSEYSCKTVNQIFTSSFSTQREILGFETLSVLFTAKRIIERLLGLFDLDELERGCGWGPGATTSLRRTHGHSAYKFENLKPHGTQALAPYVKAYVGDQWSPDMVETQGSRTITVPKNAKTDRLIAIEPDLNMFFQKGIGAMIRSRLNRLGLLLPDAQERNKILARQASIDGSLATVDLSAASDSISYELVRFLLPDQWFFHIANTRSASTWIENKWVRLQKMSSMGNGYTFELETLLFWAITSACNQSSDRTVSVYGDDIICPVGAVPLLSRVLEAVGFSFNQEKTFHHGMFRESCGGHYFNGLDVTPFYFQHSIRSEADSYVVLNKIQLWSHTGVFGKDPLLRPAFDACRGMHVADFGRLLTIPRCFPENSGCVTSFDVAKPSAVGRSKNRAQWEGFRVKYLANVGKPDAHADTGCFISTLHRNRHRDRPSDGFVSPYPMSSNRYRVQDGVSQQWDSYDKWLSV